jgi:hypothetical protein
MVTGPHAKYSASFRVASPARQLVAPASAPVTIGQPQFCQMSRAALNTCLREMARAIERPPVSNTADAPKTSASWQS